MSNKIICYNEFDQNYIDLNKINKTAVEKLTDNPETINKIQQIANGMISWMQKSNDPLYSINTSNIDAIDCFLKKTEIIIDKLKPERKEVPFPIHLYTLHTLQIFIDLKKSLSATNQEILQHPLLKKLKILSEQKELKEPVGVAKDFLEFQKNVLNPTLDRATTHEEIEALRPVITLCCNLKNKIKDFDEIGTLDKLIDHFLSLFDYKFVQTSGLYRFIISYQAGIVNQPKNFGEKCMNELRRLQPALTHIAGGSHMSTKNKIAFYHSVLQIQQDCDSYEILDPVIDDLVNTFALYEEIKNSFILELEQLIKPGIIENPKFIAIRLKEFERHCLIPMLKQVRTQKELQDLTSPVNQCMTVREKVATNDGHKSLENCHNDMINLYHEKFYATESEIVRKNSSLTQKNFEFKAEERKGSSKMSVAEKKITPDSKEQSYLQNIQNKITSLDLQSFYFSENVKTILLAIGDRKNFSNEFDYLTKALYMLLNPTSFKASEEENLFISLLGEKYQIDNNQCEKLEKQIISDVQADLLKKIKESATKPDKIDSVMEQAIRQAMTSAKQKRFRHFIDQSKSDSFDFNHNFSAHYPILISNYERFSREIVMTNFKKICSELENYIDDRSKNQASQIIRNTYSYMNPSRNLETYRHDCLKEFFNALDLSKIDKMTVEELIQYLEEKISEEKTYPNQLLGGVYEQLIKLYAWFEENWVNIKEPYDQGDQIDTNLGEGVCYNNCLDRISQFAHNPMFDRNKIKMGSNKKTRFHQSKLSKMVEETKKGTMSNDETNREIENICIVYGLICDESLDFYQGNNVANDLIKQIEIYRKKGRIQALLSLRIPKEPGGHAVNLHFDKKNQIYGFEDDNVGRVEFPTFSIMKKQLTSYLQYFYPQYTRLGLDFYRLKNAS